MMASSSPLNSTTTSTIASSSTTTSTIASMSTTTSTIATSSTTTSTKATSSTTLTTIASSSTSTVSSNPMKDSDLFVRAVLCIQLVIRPAMLSVMHNDKNDVNYTGLPKDGQELYKEIEKIKKKKNQDFKFLKRSSLDLALPKSKSTNSTLFDPGLIQFFIRHGTTLMKPNNGWEHPKPWPVGSGKDSRAFSCIKAIKLRNELYHPKSTKLTEVEFEKLWGDVEDIVKTLGYFDDYKELLQRLKTGSLDAHLKTKVDILQDIIDGLDISSLESVKDDVKKLKSEFQNQKDIVLPSVIDITCHDIGEEWEKLALELGIKVDDATAFKVAANTKKLLWVNLRSALKRIQKDNIVDKIVKETLITEGLRDASNNLRKRYESLGTHALTSALADANGRPHTTTQPLEKAFVDLAIVDKWDDNFTSDMDYHKKTNYLKRTQNVKLENIVQPEDKFVFIRGVAGIGKSMVAKFYTFKWHECGILNGEQHLPRIDFLFRITCQQLNEMKEDMSVEDILKALFPNVFNSISLNDLNELSDRVMILIDGFDELKDIHQLKESLLQSNHLVYKAIRLLDIENGILPGHKTLVTGRPEACSDLYTYFSNRSSNYLMKCICICGFDEENQRQYIQNYFDKQSTEISVKKQEKVHRKLDESKNLKLMASIPIYLWVICELFNNDDVKAPQTITELCAYACILFIRKHAKITDGVSLQKLSLADMIENHPEVLDIIYLLATLSRDSMVYKSKTIFSADKLQSLNNIPPEKTGFIYEYYDGEQKKRYQFKHLILNEFFASLLLYVQPGLVVSELKKDCFKPCLHIVSGLCGIAKSIEDLNENQKKSPIQNFLLKFVDRYKNINFFTKVRYHLSSFRCSGFFPLVEWKLTQEMCKRNKSNTIVIGPKLTDMLSVVFEYQGSFSDKFLTEVNKKKIEISNIIHQIDIRNMIYFIEKISQDARFDQLDIAKLEVETRGGRSLPDDFINVVKKFYAGIKDTENKKTKVLYFSRLPSEDKIMRIETIQDGNKTGLHIQVPDQESIDKNESIFKDMMHQNIIDEISLYNSLSTLYRPLIVMAGNNYFPGEKISIKETDILKTGKSQKVNVAQLEIGIEAELRFPDMKEGNSLHVKGSRVLQAYFVEGKLFLGLPKLDPEDHLFTLLKEYFRLKIFTHLIIETSASEHYQKLKGMIRSIDGNGHGFSVSTPRRFNVNSTSGDVETTLNQPCVKIISNYRKNDKIYPSSMKALVMELECRLAPQSLMQASALQGTTYSLKVIKSKSSDQLELIQISEEEFQLSLYDKRIFEEFHEELDDITKSHFEFFLML